MNGWTMSPARQRRTIASTTNPATTARFVVTLQRAPIADRIIRQPPTSAAAVQTHATELPTTPRPYSPESGLAQDAQELTQDASGAFRIEYGARTGSVSFPVFPRFSGRCSTCDGGRNDGSRGEQSEGWGGEDNHGNQPRRRNGGARPKGADRGP